MELHILKSGLPHDTGHFSCVDGQVSRESIGVESIMNRQSGRCRAGGQSFSIERPYLLNPSKENKYNSAINAMIAINLNFNNLNCENSFTGKENQEYRKKARGLLLAELKLGIAECQAATTSNLYKSSIDTYKSLISALQSFVEIIESWNKNGYFSTKNSLLLINIGIKLRNFPDNLNNITSLKDKAFISCYIIKFAYMFLHPQSPFHARYTMGYEFEKFYNALDKDLYKKYKNKEIKADKFCDDLYKNYFSIKNILKEIFLILENMLCTIDRSNKNSFTVCKYLFLTQYECPRNINVIDIFFNEIKYTDFQFINN